VFPAVGFPPGNLAGRYPALLPVEVEELTPPRHSLKIVSDIHEARLPLSDIIDVEVRDGRNENEKRK